MIVYKSSNRFSGLKCVALLHNKKFEDLGWFVRSVGRDIQTDIQSEDAQNSSVSMTSF